MVMPFAPEDIQFVGVFIKFAACYRQCEGATYGESCGKVEQGRRSSASAHWRPRSAPYRILEPSCQTGRHERSTRVHTDHLDTYFARRHRPPITYTGSAARDPSRLAAVRVVLRTARTLQLNRPSQTSPRSQPRMCAQEDSRVIYHTTPGRGRRACPLPVTKDDAIRIKG